MTLIEEKTLADHDINVKSMRQELQLLEEQLKKHGRNESQPSPSVTDEDAVSRKAAIKAIRDTYGVLYPIDMISKADAADVLNDLPCVNPSRPNWIPVTERMPETNIDVLLTSWSGYSQYVGWLDDLGTWHSGDEEVIKGFEPIAWMPLPDPYQEK